MQCFKLPRSHRLPRISKKRSLRTLIGLLRVKLRVSLLFSGWRKVRLSCKMLNRQPSWTWPLVKREICSKVFAQNLLSNNYPNYLWCNRSLVMINPMSQSRQESSASLRCQTLRANRLLGKRFKKVIKLSYLKKRWKKLFMASHKLISLSWPPSTMISSLQPCMTITSQVHMNFSRLISSVSFHAVEKSLMKWSKSSRPTPSKTSQRTAARARLLIAKRVQRMLMATLRALWTKKIKPSRSWSTRALSSLRGRRESETWPWKRQRCEIHPIFDQ